MNTLDNNIEDLKAEIEKLKNQLDQSQAKYREKVEEVQNLRNEAHTKASENAKLLGKVQTCVAKYRNNIQHDFYHELTESLTQWSLLVAKELHMAKKEQEVAEKFVLLQHELFLSLKNRGYRQFQSYDAQQNPRCKRPSKKIPRPPPALATHQPTDPSPSTLNNPQIVDETTTIDNPTIIPSELSPGADEALSSSKPTPTNIIIKDCDGIVTNVSPLVDVAVNHGAALGSNPWACSQLEARAVDAANFLDLRHERLVRQDLRQRQQRYGGSNTPNIRENSANVPPSHGQPPSNR